MNKQIIKLLFIGNILEYYDFAIYGVFSIVMAPAFFPVFDTFAQTLLALLVFVSGFIARPFGGIIFGYIGDQYGRKNAVMVSISGMAMATFLIGMLPVYAKLGLLAPMLLVLLRIIQGICIGGEGTGMTIFILEHRYKHKRGFLNGLVSASGITGTLIATVIGLVLNYLPLPTDVKWRAAFILGGLLGGLALIIRSHIMETPVFAASIRHSNIGSIPLIQLIKSEPKKLLIAICLAGMLGTMCYFMMLYINILLKMLGFSTNKSMILTSWGIMCLIAFMPVIGIIADLYDYKKIIFVVSIIILLFAKNCFDLILSGQPLLVLVGITLMGILSAGFAAPAYQYMFDLFAPLQRYSGMAFSFNVGMALFGSTMPLIATYLQKITGSYLAPVFYIMFMAVLTLIAMITNSEIAQSYD